MKSMQLGKTQITISRIGLGTWAMGGGPAWGGDSDVEESVATILNCIDLGINLIDTAPAYNFGNSEKIIGEALKQFKRDKANLITKCGITWTKSGSPFIKVGDVDLYKNLSRESIEEDLKMSLARLGTDYIDVYMTHWQSIEPFFTPISETMEVLNDLKKKGLIRAIGAANVTPDQIKEYVKYGDLDVVQCKYSILDRNVEQEILPLCKEYGITMQAYSPLEQGLLTGAIGYDYTPLKGSAHYGKHWFIYENLVKALDMIKGWGDLRSKYNCTTANLAMAWILSQGDFINILSGATTVAQIEENIKALDFELTASDVQSMREAAENID